MNKTSIEQQRTAASEWEGEGGAIRQGEQQGATPADGKRDGGPELAQLDARHDSSTRGEHRYPDANQTAAERDARGTRDELKRRLGGGGAPRRR